MTNDGKYKAALAVTFDSDAGDGLTVRGYLRTLLSNLWQEEEDFSGKRPFGNSGWQPDVTHALAAAGFVDFGKPHIEEGYPPSYNPTDAQVRLAHAFVGDLILFALREPQK